MAAYREAFPDCEIYFLGCEGGFESRMVPAHGMRLRTIAGLPFARQGPAGRIRAAGAFLRAVKEARNVLASEGTRLVIGLGGYASAAPVIAARRVGLATVIHEANAAPGMANRLASRWADLVCVGWESTAARFPRNAVAVTGNPVRHDFVRGGPRATGEARRVLVTGGSEGSAFLNECAAELMAGIASRGVAIEVLHQSGMGAGETVRERYRRAGVSARVEEFVEDMAGAYAQTDFAVTSAGALTLAELAATGLPALIVPSNAVAGAHQHANAIAYAERTGNPWTAEERWNAGALADHIAQMLCNAPRLEELGRAAAATARPDAAMLVVRECERVMREKW